MVNLTMAAIKLAKYGSGYLSAVVSIMLVLSQRLQLSVAPPSSPLDVLCSVTARAGPAAN